ncbi:MAG TPA: pyridoxal phosphate-dependent aminotransferase [Gallionella sp.]|nr:pyridoxal phosphate-dependent aminotransferase [Gallionella sp.]
MSSEFDEIIPRRGTSSFKYDGRMEIFGTEDVVPLWVADMDFAVPAAVRDALVERAAHPIYGYTVYPESLYDALIAWQQKRHGWKVERDWIVMCPGVVPSVHAAIMALSQPDDVVIVQPPVYGPFFGAAKSVGRRLLLNPLRFENGRYRFDLEHFERCAAEGARLLLLCSPHNPVGRVWQTDELLALLEICERCDVTVVSDEIHADLVYPGSKHKPLAGLSDGAVKIVTAVAPSKTFNIPGLGLSALIVPDEKDRAAIAKAFGMLHVGAANPFSIVAFEAAYRNGAPWLDELLVYIEENYRFVRKYLQQHLPLIKLTAPEGTYLLWLDCRAMGLNDEQLEQFFVRQAGVGLSPGIIFGEQGSGFMRMNIAVPRSVIAGALEKMAGAEKLRI